MPSLSLRRVRRESRSRLCVQQRRMRSAVTPQGVRKPAAMGMEDG